VPLAIGAVPLDKLRDTRVDRMLRMLTEQIFGCGGVSVGVVALGKFRI